MSVNLLTTGTTPQRRNQLALHSRDIFEFRAGDGSVALTATGGADLTTLTARSGHTGVFARNSAALVVTRGGLLASTFVNFPALNSTYDSTFSTWSRRGLLLAGARTNLFASADISAGTDIGSPGTAAATGPGNGITGYTITDNDAGAAEGEQLAVTFTGDAVKGIAIAIKKGTADVSALVLRDTSLNADLLSPIWTWSGTDPGTPSVAVGTYLGKLQLANDWWAVFFSSASATAGSTNVLRLYGASTVVGTTGSTLWALPLAENAVFPGMLKTAALAQAIDSLYFETKTPPVAMTGYVRFIERGSVLGANDTRLLHLGLTNATTDPRLIIDVQSNLYRLLHDNGSAEVTSTMAAAPTLGALVELRAELFTDGSVRLHQSIAEATETSASASAANTLGTTWGGAATARLYLNSDPAAGNAGHVEILSVGFAPGTGYTMAQLRSRFA